MSKVPTWIRYPVLSPVCFQHQGEECECGYTCIILTGEPIVSLIFNFFFIYTVQILTVQVLIDRSNWQTRQFFFFLKIRLIIGSPFKIINEPSFSAGVETQQNLQKGERFLHYMVSQITHGSLIKWLLWISGLYVHVKWNGKFDYYNAFVHIGSNSYYVFFFSWRSSTCA